MKTNLTFTLSKPMRSSLVRLARRKKKSVSSLLRSATKQWLDQYGGFNKPAVKAFSDKQGFVNHGKQI